MTSITSRYQTTIHSQSETLPENITTIRGQSETLPENITTTHSQSETLPENITTVNSQSETNLMSTHNIFYVFMEKHWKSSLNYHQIPTYLFLCLKYINFLQMIYVHDFHKDNTVKFESPWKLNVKKEGILQKLNLWCQNSKPVSLA